MRVEDGRSRRLGSQVSFGLALHFVHARIDQALARTGVQHHGLGQNLHQQGRAADIFQANSPCGGDHGLHHPILFAQMQLEIAWMAFMLTDGHPLPELAIVLADENPFGCGQLLWRSLTNQTRVGRGVNSTGGAGASGLRRLRKCCTQHPARP